MKFLAFGWIDYLMSSLHTATEHKMTQFSPEQEKQLSDYLKILEALPNASTAELLKNLKIVHKYTRDITPFLLAVIEHKEANADILHGVAVEIANCPIGMWQTFIMAAVKGQAKRRGISLNGYTTMILNQYLPNKRQSIPPTL